MEEENSQQLLQTIILISHAPRYLRKRSNSRIVKFSGSFSSMYKIVYSILKRITLHVGSLSRGKCENMENPSNINSCSSCLIIVGVLVCNIKAETGPVLVHTLHKSREMHVYYVHRDVTYSKIQLHQFC